MASVYNKAFCAGAWLNLTVFIVFNVVSSADAIRRENASLASGIRFSGGGYYFAWGFPFFWADPSGLGLIVNVFVIAFFSFAAGFIVRFMWLSWFEKEID